MEYPEKNFECQLCGECCSGKMKVFLNPGDLKKMVAYLKLSCNQDLLDQGWICLDLGQRDQLLPRIAFKKSQKLEFCPFLENRIEADGTYRGLCRLHSHLKPLVCALSPFARELDLENGGDHLYFVPPVSDCPGSNVSTRHHFSEFFPQLEEELQKETRFFKVLEEMLKKSCSPNEILKQLFQLTPS